MNIKFIAISGLIFFLASCEVKKTDTSDNDAREKNLEATTEINRAIETGDVSKLQNYIAADAVDHASPAGDIKGSDSIISMLGEIHKMSTNIKVENIRTVADGEYVFQWLRLTGTTATEDMGMPIGTNYDINAVEVSRFNNGKQVEHWEFMQPADMAKMMGGPVSEPSIKELPITDTVKRP